jgi:hypothetical protein
MGSFQDIENNAARASFPLASHSRRGILNASKNNPEAIGKWLLLFSTSEKMSASVPVS